MLPYKSIEQIEEHNRANGKNFFDPKTKKYWKSIIYSEIVNGHFFVTSEKSFDGEKRLYTLRIVLDGGRIDTIGKFQQFPTKELALKYARTLPKYLPHAIQCAIESWNNNTNEFINAALTEPLNAKQRNRYSFDPATFCGACTWLINNSKQIEFEYLIRTFLPEFEERLRG